MLSLSHTIVSILDSLSFSHKHTQSLSILLRLSLSHYFSAINLSMDFSHISLSLYPSLLFMYRMSIYLTDPLSVYTVFSYVFRIYPSLSLYLLTNI